MVSPNAPIAELSPAAVAEAPTLHGYLPDDGLATAIFLALSLRRPLLLEGAAGVGKTEVAKALSRGTGGPAVLRGVPRRRPRLREGEAGVGKTEVAKVLSRWTGGELIRLQCYEGIDAAQAVYDWDYSRQLLHLRAAEATGEARGRGAGARGGGV